MGERIEDQIGQDGSVMSRLAEIEVVVLVEINDPDVVDRITGSGGDEWRSQFYDLRTEDDVLAHLARNCIANGVERADRLEGWGDLDTDAATMELTETIYTGSVAA